MQKKKRHLKKGNKFSFSPDGNGNPTLLGVD